MNVLLCQLTSINDLEINRQEILKLLKTQDLSLIDLILLPENALYMRLSKEEPIYVVTFKEAVFHDLQRLCDEFHVAIHIGSCAVQEKDKTFNASVFLEPFKEPRMSYQKIHLFDFEMQNHRYFESDVFSHGQGPQFIDYMNCLIGQSICYDLRFSELYSAYAKQGAEIILVPSAFLVPTGKAHWHTLLRARAIENQAYVLASAQAGNHKQMHQSYGHSLAIDPWGELLIDLKDQSPSCALLELDLNRVQEVRQKMPMASHRKI